MRVEVVTVSRNQVIVDNDHGSLFLTVFDANPQRRDKATATILGPDHAERIGLALIQGAALQRWGEARRGKRGGSK